jgi:iron(III) transport system ATP-binding protein
MWSVIEDLGEKLNITCLAVLHDPADILSWADTILVMKDGWEVQKGSPQEIYFQPVNEYVAGLFGHYSIIENTIAPQPSAETGKKRLLRPEHVHISKTPGTGINGTVQKILFRGNYYLIDVWTGGQMIRAQANDNIFAAGDIVQLSWSPADIVYLD